MPSLRLTALLTCALAGWGTNALAQQSETVELGNVSVVLTTAAGDQGICSSDPRLQVQRFETAYRLDVDEDLEAGAACVVTGLSLQDLNNDSEPEILLTTYSGGAHCCTSSLIYTYSPPQDAYVRLSHFWGNTGYRLEDLDGDRRPEFLSLDDRFAYAFTSYAGSRYPLQIRRYQGDRLENVSAQFPDRVYGHAYALWLDYQDLVATRSPETASYQREVEQAVLAAYLADKYTLGQGEDGWRRVMATYQWSDRQAFFTALRDFLGELGYLTNRVE